MLRVVYDSLYSSKNRRAERGTKYQKHYRKQTEYDFSHEPSLSEFRQAIDPSVGKTQRGERPGAEFQRLPPTNG
jgi:hypothetical protein